MELLKNLQFIFQSILVFQCAVFAVFLLIPGKGNRTGNIFFALMLIFMGLITFGGILINQAEPGEVTDVGTVILFYFLFPFQYLWIPFFYLYTLTLTRHSFRFQKKHLIHFIPFGVIFIRVLIFVPLNRPVLIEKVMAPDLFYSFESDLYYIFEYVQFYFYTIVSIHVISRFRKQVKEIHSSISRTGLFWLSNVLYVILIWKSLKLFGVLLVMMNRMSAIYITIYILAGLLFIVFLSIMFLRGVNYPGVFLYVDEKQKGRKYEKTILPEELKEKYSAILTRHMEIEKPYLDPDLNLKILSDHLNIPLHHLSQVINSTFGQNYYDFINSYRIRESIRLLDEDISGTKTILEILYETGFNSKSVFNTFFKKYTKLTPTQYRKQHHS